tara:strand:+ start:1083 stop:1778 length:696 start_codon:yes stop_codon:yes gene_type:complete
LSKIIRIQKLKKKITQYNQENTILPECSLSIDRGDMVAITGQSGIGKSTLLNIIGCLDHPTSGNYFLENHNISTLSLEEKALIRKKTFGYIFQQYWLIKHLTIIENIELALEYLDGNQHNTREIALATLASIGIPQYAEYYPMHLSGGQQQKASIARAIVTKPSIIIADEPTGALDHNNSMQIMDLLKKINREQQTTIIVVTHDREIAGLCNRRLPMETLFNNKEKMYAQA